MYSRWVPHNQTFSVLCLPNYFSLEFTGSKFLRTTDYAFMNSYSFTQFTWEASVFHSTLTGKQTYLSWHNTDGSYYMTFHKNSNNLLEFSVKTSSTTITVASRIALNPKTWYHVAVSYDGGVAGQLRLYYVDPYGSVVTGSDCFDDVCLSGSLSGTIGIRGKGLGSGVSKLSGTLAGCTVGMTLSAYGGGVCDTGYVGQVCTTASDCGGGLVTGTCKVGSGFAATITAVDAGGSITEIYVTDPGRYRVDVQTCAIQMCEMGHWCFDDMHLKAEACAVLFELRRTDLHGSCYDLSSGYLSNPKLVASSSSCTCQSNAGNVAGNLDPCLAAIRSTGFSLYPRASALLVPLCPS